MRVYVRGEQQEWPSELQQDYKFEYGYHDSACRAENNGDHIALSYDRIPKPPVKINNIGLDVEKVLIYSPSLHLYDGQKQPGEIMIIHKSYQRELIVCIPITVSESSNTLLDEIAIECGKTIIEEDSSATLNINNYNLSQFIDNENTYIYYSSDVPSECKIKSDVIVFAKNNVNPCSITQNNLNIIRALVTFPIISVYDNVHFYSAKPPIKMSGNENYTRCYSESTLPGGLPSKPEEPKKETKDKNTLEGFTNIDDIIPENGIHVNTIIYTSLALFAGYVYIHNVLTK